MKGFRVSSLVWRTGTVFLSGSLVFAIVSFSILERTTRPQFCTTCHIMEPYYESWKHSSHNNVNCVVCHYEPGAIETLKGKFLAISQVVKYVTGTEGTKPWAEVSDRSCMRVGCHQQRLLWGRIPFGRVYFDHRHHLLESRRGRRLRCTTCHSQIVQGEHLTVTTSVCFICHFKVSKTSESHAECNLCHGPPKESIEVSPGISFSHGEFVERGVPCLDCHRNVTRGDGRVRKERCHACHGRVEHLERFGETAFIHETHVTLHKVECFECHDEIAHSLPPRNEPLHPGKDCTTCHETFHNEPSLFYSGLAGGLDKPDPMYLCLVDCKACHEGGHDGGGKGAAGAEKIERACMRCHGTGYKGMLLSWQRSVKGSLERLDALREKEARAAADSPGAAAEVAAAGDLLGLVERDGSMGAHNLELTTAILEKGLEHLRRARKIRDPGAKPPDVRVGPAAKTAFGCTERCHLAVEEKNLLSFGKGSFPHRTHALSTLIDCDACHGVEKADHGTVRGRVSSCDDCHHDSPFTSNGCQSCHDRVKPFLNGTLAGFNGTVPSDMADLDCEDCHAEAGRKGKDTIKEACEDCHEKGYGKTLERWTKTLAVRMESAKKALAAAREKTRRPGRAEGGAGGPEGTRKAVERAGALLESLSAAGPAHNFAFSLKVLDDVDRIVGEEKKIPASKK